MEGLNIEKLDKSNWSTYRFDNIAFKRSERIDPNNTDLEIYVGLEHLDSESLHIRRFGTRDDVNGTKFRCYPGDIIFGRRRAYQRKAAIVDFNGFCSAHSLVLYPNEEVIDAALFPFFLHSDAFMHRAVDISVGSLSPTINWKTLRSQEFLLPPKDQQARLAKMLWAGDTMVEKKMNLKFHLERTLLTYRQKEIINSTPMRTELGSHIENIVAGRSLKGTNTPVEDEEKGVVKVSAVGKYEFKAAENKILNDQKAFIEKYRISKGDVLITRANTRELVGKVCIVDRDYPHLMLSDKTLKLQFDGSTVDSVFMVEVLKSREARVQIEGYATGTGGAMKNISQNEIRKICVPLPDVEKQNIYAQKVRSILNARISLLSEIQSLRALQKSLINQIF